MKQTHWRCVFFGSGHKHQSSAFQPSSSVRPKAVCMVSRDLVVFCLFLFVPCTVEREEWLSVWNITWWIFMQLWGCEENLWYLFQASHTHTNMHTIPLWNPEQAIFGPLRDKWTHTRTHCTPRCSAVHPHQCRADLGAQPCDLGVNGRGVMVKINPGNWVNRMYTPTQTYGTH